MHRFYLPPGKTRDAELLLEDGEAHHAHNVLRIRPGEQVTVLNGAGEELICTVESLSRREVRLRVLHRQSFPPPPFAVSLIQAIPRAKVMDSIVQKGTELGVSRIVPLLSERVTVRVDETSASEKPVKWTSVAIEAIKQCGTPWLPTIQPPITLKQLLDRHETADLALVGSLQPGSRHPRHWFDQYRQRHNGPPRSVHIWIGPEGDFTPAELEMIQAAGAHPITLGPYVLRSDTAALYCLSVTNHELRQE
ncbi:MAG TPA: 16S rRNA (uracil(1498)-N(3))-methyltransferase [Verrucomicrobia bacterium]|nr:16S rRNA (uracil(1498)-N(3))-methyltransferase [Verrucomicrobiota bacterium]HOB32749.1 RsmE family RNA methyltransferase [Verrucomicrobiota bacterium]HOP96942.1 RsmE family RNA methyltransferase [Verrucomicrobiota bacterium]HPU55437.1 RsmE family RNA methyltransferase [Verrucomicrobiota bacterium]